MKKYYYKERSKEWYRKNRGMLLEKQREERKNPEIRKKWTESMNRSYRKAADLWGVKRGRTAREKRDMGDKAEIFVAQIVLPPLGFSDIVLGQLLHQQFPFDILAKKNGRRVAIEVTTAFHKQIKPIKRWFLDYIDADFYVCHVKSDLTQYFLLPLQFHNRLTSNCRGLFMESVRKKENVKFTE